MSKRPSNPLRRFAISAVVVGLAVTLATSSPAFAEDFVRPESRSSEDPPRLTVKQDARFMFTRSSKMWTGHLGELQLSEKEFFFITGHLDRAEQARVHQSWRASFKWTGRVFLIVGGMVFLASYSESADPDAATIGLVTIGVGVILDIVTVFMGKNASSVELADRAADQYNTRMGLD